LEENINLYSVDTYERFIQQFIDFHINIENNRNVIQNKDDLITKNSSKIHGEFLVVEIIVDRIVVA
jgi:hypothetical protein